MSTAHPTLTRPDCHSFGCSLAAICRYTVGALCVVSGLVLTLTLWLMVIGIPLALFGVALIAADLE